MVMAGEWGASYRPWHRCSCCCEGGLKHEDGGRRRLSRERPGHRGRGNIHTGERVAAKEPGGGRA